MKNQNLMPASSLSGNYVKNAQGDNLGHVKEIMVDIEYNRVAYYVLSFGGLMGMGDKLFAIPPEVLRRNVNDNSFTLDVSKDILKNTQGFNKENWPDMADSSFRSTLYKHYGVEERSAA